MAQVPKGYQRHLGNEVCINHLPPIRNDSLAHRESCQSRSSLKSLVTKADGRSENRCDQPETRQITMDFHNNHDQIWLTYHIQQTLYNTLAKLFVRYLITIYNIWIQSALLCSSSEFLEFGCDEFISSKNPPRNFYRKSNSLESWSNRKYREKKVTQKLDDRSHRIHVWYIYLHWVDFYGKCRWLYHTRMLWETGWPVVATQFFFLEFSPEFLGEMIPNFNKLGAANREDGPPLMDRGTKNSKAMKCGHLEGGRGTTVRGTYYHDGYKLLEKLGCCSKYLLCLRNLLIGDYSRQRGKKRGPHGHGTDWIAGYRYSCMFEDACEFVTVKYWAVSKTLLFDIGDDILPNRIRGLFHEPLYYIRCKITVKIPFLTNQYDTCFMPFSGLKSRWSKCLGLNFNVSLGVCKSRRHTGTRQMGGKWPVGRMMCQRTLSNI